MLNSADRHRLTNEFETDDDPASVNKSTSVSRSFELATARCSRLEPISRLRLILSLNKQNNLFELTNPLSLFSNAVDIF